jgi:spore coat protein CotH
MDKYIDGQEYDGLDKFNLNNGANDPTQIREKLTLDFLQDIDASAPRCSYANVYLNGTLWGIYTVVEQVEGDFLKQHFDEKDGNLFKGGNQATLHWLGSNQASYYLSYELKTNEDLNDYTDLLHLIDQIDNSSDEEFYDSVESVLNTDAFIQYWAYCNILANFDSYYAAGNNYYVYHNQATDLFEFITWDVNETFGVVFTDNMPVQDVYELSIEYVSSNVAGQIPLLERMLEHDVYFEKYTDQIYDILKNHFTKSLLFPKVDSIADVIRTSIYADTKRNYTSQDFEDNIEMTINSFMGQIAGIKPFIEYRWDALNELLVSFGYQEIGLKPIVVDDDATVRVYPNPFNDHIVVIGSAGQTIKFNLYDMTGQ